ncbi:unnamed protein product [Brassica rapa]|uniref:Uncharacterized protein n=2 Tax=Brassica TaxID=3705 RepID=A0A3P6AJY5_BRACM|nr:unnamed protein product [Brassica napus]CAG7891788.1 unnamed protein product [Brassica rapa]VDC85550.1 unnamed protein product [Brassica rapa]
MCLLSVTNNLTHSNLFFFFSLSFFFLSFGEEHRRVKWATSLFHVSLHQW